MSLEQEQRQYVLKVLLIASILLTGFAALEAWIGQLRPNSPDHAPYSGLALGVTLICCLFIAGFYLFQKGYTRLIAFLMVWLYLTPTIYATALFGTTTPQLLLTESLIIVMSGILIGTRFALIITFIISVTLILFTYLQINFLLHIYDGWRHRPPTMRDAYVYCATMSVIAGISWLFNQKVQTALQKAHQYEVQLKKQNEHLEQLVEERTAQLQISQAEKVAQLYRFAEFGKLASGLFHDLASPLTLVSLNLQELNTVNKGTRKRRLELARDSLSQAVAGTAKLESFLQAARKQLQNQETKQRFSMNQEIVQSIQLLTYRARKARVTITFQPAAKVSLYANPIKFSQLITNLLANAIDSYSNYPTDKREVILTLQKRNKGIQIKVQDFGQGIEEDDLSQIFDPLFTTKQSDKGTGLGLAIVQRIVQQDFKGKIKVISRLNQGTSFIIQMPLTSKAK